MPENDQKQLECPSCGAALGPTDTVCPVCGSSVVEEIGDDLDDLEDLDLDVRSCPHCGATLAEDDTTCLVCGGDVPFEADEPAELEAGIPAGLEEQPELEDLEELDLEETLVSLPTEEPVAEPLDMDLAPEPTSPTADPKIDPQLRHDA